MSKTQHWVHQWLGNSCDHMEDRAQERKTGARGGIRRDGVPIPADKSRRPMVGDGRGSRCGHEPADGFEPAGGRLGTDTAVAQEAVHRLDPKAAGSLGPSPDTAMRRSLMVLGCDNTPARD